MGIDDLTVREVKELVGLVRPAHVCATSDPSPYDEWVGKNLFIRTVTHHYTGKLVSIYRHELVVEDAAWIASDGQFANAIERGEYDEVEPYPAGKIVIGRGAIVDVCLHNGGLPRTRK